MMLGALPGDPTTLALALGILALGPLVYIGWQRPAVLVVLLLVSVAIPVEATLTQPVEGTLVLADAASIFVVTVIGFRALLRPRPSVNPLLATLVGSALIASAIATFFATDGLASLAGFVRFTQMLVFVPLATYLAIESRDDQRLFLGALILLGLFESAVAIHQYVTGTGASFASAGATEAVDVRAFGTFDASNIQPLPIIVTAALLAAFATVLWSAGRVRILALVATLALTAGLLASLSRGAWVAAILGAFVIALCRNYRVTLAFAAAAAILAGVVLPVIGGGSAAGGVLTERATSLAETPTNPDQSVESRYGLWDAAISIWSENPVTGVGIRGFVNHRDNHVPLDTRVSSDVSDPASGFRRIELESPHNLFLLVLSEQGLIGLLAYGLLLATMLVFGVRRVATMDSTDGGRDFWPFQVALLGWFVSFLIRSLYGDIGGPTVVLEGVLIGAAMSVAFGLRARTE
jgi:O-antigen ligase